MFGSAPKTLTALSCVFASIVAVAGFAPAAHAATDCTTYAATTGSDDAPGTQAAPLRTVQALADSLRPGDTGCLRGGSYDNGVVFRSGGTPQARITLRSTPGEKVTINSEVRVARTAPYVTVEGLYINGASLNHTTPTINASDTIFRNNDVTNDHTEICFMLGNPAWGRADRALLENNRIHDCGQLPSRNQDHGIYVAAATDVHIQNNWIYNNADRGIQLYPDAQNTTITGNIINNNGEGIIISGDDGSASSGTTIAGNVIANSNIRSNIESWWGSGAPRGTRNVVRDNCMYASQPDAYYRRNGGIDTSGGGFSSDTSNVEAAPAFANVGAGDFRLAESSPCRGAAGAVADRVAGPGTLGGDAPLPAVPSSPIDPPATIPPVAVKPTARIPVPAPARPVAATPRPAARTATPRPTSKIRLVLRGRRAFQSSSSRRLELAGRTLGTGVRGRRVKIEVLLSGRWTTIARSRVTRRGSFAARVDTRSLRRLSRVQIRASVSGLGHSTPLTVTLREHR